MIVDIIHVVGDVFTVIGAVGAVWAAFFFTAIWYEEYKRD